MFLDWIAQLQTNILGSLPLSIRRVLISEITTYLHPPPGKQAPDPSIFCSPAHIKWFMEVIGQGFNLPLEDMAITNDDVEIYSRWLFEPQTRPAAVMKEGLEQEFYQIIFHQFSLLFQPRIARNSIVPTQDKSHLLPPKPSSSFHINMLPVGAHSTIVPITFNPPTSSSTPTSNTNANSGTTNAASTATSGLQSNPNNSNSQATLKETLSQLVQRHIELCKKSLRVFAMAGRTLKMSTDTWSVLLKVMLGITDYLLKEPTGESSTMGVMNMGDELCDSLLQVLFELWLRSNTMDVEMWDILKSCFGRWIHRPKAIQQWSSTSLAITKRIQHLVYGDQENAEGVFVSGPNVKLDLPNEFTYYAWHRIIYLIPHPLQLPSHNFTLAMLGIGNLVDTLNSAIETTDTMASPDGNTLLNMFGTYLFDAASKSNQADTEAQRGCAESLATLCRIFCKPQRRQPFLRTYIERFYAALMTGLKSEACLPTILLSCTELFATDLEGVRMLVPDFISAIKMVLPKLTFEYKTNVSVDNLRLAAIKVLSTIMCLPNHFDKVELAKSSWDSSDVSLESVSVIRVLYASPAEGNSDKPCLSLKFYILEVLLKSLRTETSSYNMRYILHLINVYVIEDVPFCPGLVGTILTMQLPADVTLVAFDVLMDFVDLYDFVKRDSKNVARELVLALSRYVDTLITAGKLAQTYPLIVQAYDCMIKWILISQWIIDDRDCYKAVIATLSKGITIFDREAANLAAPTEPVNVEKKKRRETGFPPTKQLFQLPPRVNKTSHHHTDQTQQPSSSNPNSRNSSAVRKKEEVAVRMAAEYCMSQFVNHLGQFISPDNKKILEESIDDVAQLKQLLASEEAEYSIRSFLIDKRTVLTLIDTTKTSDDNVPAITVIIRDTTGKYVWSMEARYKEHVPQNIHTASLPPSTTQQSLGDNVFLKPAEARKIQKPVTVPTATAVNEKELPSLDKVFVPESESWQQWEALKSLIDRQLMNDTRKTESKFLHEYQISPTRFNIDTDTPRGFRLFLSQIGFLLPENRHHITPLHLTDSVITEMETLDMLNERDCISISAYYAVSGNVNLEELIETPPPLSQQFLQFMNCLGWPVDIAEHKGYKGKLDATICAKIPYYSDRTVEFVVNVPYFLKSSPSSEQTLSEIYQRVSSDDHVCVVWIEDVTEYKKLAKLIKTSSATQSKTMVYIFISPLKHSADSLYWIFGPLVDGIVVSRHALGSMVRSTSISAHQACRVVTDTYTRPYVIRREYIEEMAHRHRVKLPLSEFYTDVFTEKTN
ncbi:hypothetical protein CU098_005512 [Rhizopus stolonifer]|uniref:Rap-GAP domain-containing protein n=1 Tax=Rhizopus stolonifer TaxID=4846 RepID=A0A367KHZ3_RHIST|nr:hypothetical protein CU098_005512 [Rhizopus stolonifer]